MLLQTCLRFEKRLQLANFGVQLLTFFPIPTLDLRGERGEGLRVYIAFSYCARVVRLVPLWAYQAWFVTEGSTQPFSTTEFQCYLVALSLTGSPALPVVGKGHAVRL